MTEGMTLVYARRWFALLRYKNESVEERVGDFLYFLLIDNALYKLLELPARMHDNGSRNGTLPACIYFSNKSIGVCFGEPNNLGGKWLAMQEQGEPGGVVFFEIEADHDDFDGFASVVFCQLIELRQLLHTGCAPCGPEVDNIECIF